MGFGLGVVLLLFVVFSRVDASPRVLHQGKGREKGLEQQGKRREVVEGLTAKEEVVAECERREGEWRKRESG